MPRPPQPWFQYLRDEWIDPMLDHALGRFPPGHPYYQDSVIIRYLPLAMTLGCLVAVVYGLVT
jgi:hypothetical protein